MTSDPTIFRSKQNTSHVPKIHTADGSTMSVTHSGTISTSILSLFDTYLIPKLTLNLLSVGKLCDLDLDVIFSCSGCRVQDPQTGQVLGIGRRIGRLFELISLHISSKFSSSITASTFAASLHLWHSCLGHASFGRLRTLISNGHLGHVSSGDVDCLSCQLAKQTALPFNNSTSVSTAPFDLIHSDIWGPSPTVTMGGSKYFVIFIDDYSRFTWLYLMQNRSELPQIYYNFAQMIQTQFSRSIKIFRTNNAMEYKSAEFLNLLSKQGYVIGLVLELLNKMDVLIVNIGIF